MLMPGCPSLGGVSFFFFLRVVLGRIEGHENRQIFSRIPASFVGGANAILCGVVFPKNTKFKW